MAPDSLAASEDEKGEEDRPEHVRAGERGEDRDRPGLEPVEKREVDRRHEDAARKPRQESASQHGWAKEAPAPRHDVSEEQQHRARNHRGRGEQRIDVPILREAADRVVTPRLHHGRHERQHDPDPLEVGGPIALPRNRDPAGDDEDRADDEGRLERLVEEGDGHQH